LFAILTGHLSPIQKVLAYYDLVQDLLDSYFADDVPPTLRTGSKLSKEEKPPLSEEPVNVKRDDKPKEEKKTDPPSRPWGTPATILTYYPVAFEASDEFKQAKRDFLDHVQSCFPNLELLGVQSDINCLEDMYTIETTKGDKTKYSYTTPSFQAALAKEKVRQNQLFLAQKC